uniref:Uncharacterized protein n=1 Tax=Sphaerodactylus townsendi TaxID=933632 RepID=A0ACB8FT28_9SAUR
MLLQLLFQKTSAGYQLLRLWLPATTQAPLGGLWLEDEIGRVETIITWESSKRKKTAPCLGKSTPLDDAKEKLTREAVGMVSNGSSVATAQLSPRCMACRASGAKAAPRPPREEGSHDTPSTAGGGRSPQVLDQLLLHHIWKRLTGSWPPQGGFSHCPAAIRDYEGSHNEIWT